MSRVEVLVVLTIGLVFGLITLSAINRARDTSAATQCRNNLKQLIMAAHSCNDCEGRLPPLTDQCDLAPTGDGIMSIFANLQPYIEAGPAYYIPKRSSPSNYHAHSSAVFTYPRKDGTMSFSEEGGMANRAWRLFTDPADSTASRLRDVPMTLPDGTTGYYATGSYAANGLITWGTGRIQESFTDGIANTVMFAERPQVCQTANGETVYNLWGLGIYSPHMPAFATLTPTDPPRLLSTGQIAPVKPLPPRDATDREARILVRIGRQDSTPCPPDFRAPVQMLRGSAACDPRLPGALHLSGMQAMMADGSIRVFVPNTHLWIFWAACTPDGGASEFQ